MIRISSDGTQLDCEGRWTLNAISDLHHELKKLLKQSKNIQQINVTGINKMDTAGALFLHDLLKQLRDVNSSVKLFGLRQKFQSLFDLVTQESGQLHLEVSEPVSSENAFSVVGEWAVDKYYQFLSFFAFLGEMMIIIFHNIVNPKNIHWKSTFKIVEETGFQALPIVGLMNFLIGVVLAYQLTTELKLYGASVFVVDVSGIAILREFAPLITAIIMAGRTSTSFAALIGTMKVNEEIDALRSMGIPPLQRLVMPRIFGLIISMPLLTVWAVIFGVLGSMIMSFWLIDLSYFGYLERFQQVVALKQLMLGLIKVPVFAVIISAVGCFQGFQVGTSANSVGWKTTKSAVQAIFLIIVADAAFSVLYSAMGI